MACTCRLGKKASKVTRLKRTTKAAGLPTADDQATVAQFIEQKRKKSAKKKARKRGGAAHARNGQAV